MFAGSPVPTIVLKRVARARSRGQGCDGSRLRGNDEGPSPSRERRGGYGSDQERRKLLILLPFSIHFASIAAVDSGRWRPEEGRSCCARSRGPANDGSRRSVDGVMGNCRGLVSSKGRRGDESHPPNPHPSPLPEGRGDLTTSHPPAIAAAYAQPFSPHPHSGHGEGCRGPHPHPHLLPSREKGPEPLPPTIAARTPKPPALILILAMVRAAGGLTLILRLLSSEGEGT